jgi:hypothetical protein
MLFQNASSIDISIENSNGYTLVIIWQVVYMRYDVLWFLEKMDLNSDSTNSDINALPRRMQLYLKLSSYQ